MKGRRSAGSGQRGGRVASEVLTRAGRSSALRFLITGVLSFIADAGLLFVFHGLLHIWLPVATALAFAGAFVVNFGLNRIWAFQADGPVGRQLFRYLLLVVANLFATVALVSGLAGLGLPYLVAKAGATGVLAVVNYLVSRKWIFL
jgi:putative flippase GtrA